LEIVMQTLWNCWRATPGAHTTTPIQRARLARLSLWAAVSWAAAAPVAMAVPVTVSAQMNSLRIETVGLNPAVRFNGLQIDGADVMEFDIPNGAVALSGAPSVSFGLAKWLNLGVNTLSFSGSTDVDVTGGTPSQPFSLGRLSFTNGSFYPTAYIGFTLTTHSDLAEYNQTFSGQWIIRSIAPANNPLPEAQADEVQVARANGLSLPGLGTLRVYERTFCPIAGDTTCNHGSVELLGHFASLHLDAFSDPQGGAFIGASPVPEPASMVLLAAGIAVLAAGAGGLRRRCP
jgi:hypothetical protein